jgi:hypothetical protein
MKNSVVLFALVGILVLMHGCTNISFAHSRLGQKRQLQFCIINCSHLYSNITTGPA